MSRGEPQRSTLEHYLDNIEVAERYGLARRRLAILGGLFVASLVFGMLFGAVVG
jgi:hypothetical protein